MPLEILRESGSPGLGRLRSGLQPVDLAEAERQALVVDLPLPCAGSEPARFHDPEREHQYYARRACFQGPCDHGAPALGEDPATGLFAEARLRWTDPVSTTQARTIGPVGDAILFAVIVATVFRTFTFEAFTIPTPSMEKSLLVGDYLFVSKLSYGPRMPMTPLTFPFTHHTMPFTASTPSFVEWFKQPYRRLPGFGDPQRGDAVVFNFPEGDTVVANFQNQSYYQLVRDYGRDKIHDPKFKMLNMVDGQVRQVETGGILVRPLDKKENYIKRCVAVAGDTLEVRHGFVFINGKQQDLPGMAQYGYEFILKDRFNERMLKEQYDISPDDLPRGRTAG
ncbi:MAG: S26 family signal peptidase [Flavobacteriales bacterium]|nr:S26 family signal peptidase [Flavobacteriales bacterium]